MMKTVILILVSLAQIGCGVESLSPSEYISWTANPDNGLIVSKEIGEYVISLRYLPTDLSVIQDLELESKQVTKEAFDSHRQKYAGSLQFLLKLGTKAETEFLRTGIQQQDEYHGRLEYYTAYVQKDLRLIANGDTMDCLLSHFERTYGVAPYNTLVIGFEGTIPESGDMVLVYDDQVLGIGRTKFTIGESSLHNIPQVKL